MEDQIDGGHRRVKEPGNERGDRIQRNFQRSVASFEATYNCQSRLPILRKRVAVHNASSKGMKSEQDSFFATQKHIEVVRLGLHSVVETRCDAARPKYLSL